MGSNQSGELGLGNPNAIYDDNSTPPLAIYQMPAQIASDVMIPELNASLVDQLGYDLSINGIYQGSLLTENNSSLYAISASTDDFSGQIDDIKLYANNLTDIELAESFRRESTPPAFTYDFTAIDTPTESLPKVEVWISMSSNSTRNQLDPLNG